jgi:hypothetical protein
VSFQRDRKETPFFSDSLSPFPCVLVFILGAPAVQTFGDPSGVVPPVTESSHAVLLSYVSEDADAARRIRAALRSAGVEVLV